MPDTNAATAAEPAEAELGKTAMALAVETLSGDIRDAMLQRIRTEKPWAEKDEYQQRSTVQQINAAAEHMVRKAVQIIAAASLPAMSGTLESVAVKGTLKTVIVFGKSSPERHKLYDAQGTEVVVVLANPSDFFGERAAVKIRPDQPDLPMGEAADEISYKVAGALGDTSFPDLVQALAESGADVLEPREVHASKWGMSRWAVLLDLPEPDNGEDAKADPYRLFDTIGAAMAFCEAAKAEGQEKALQDLIAAGELKSVTGSEATEASEEPKEGDQDAASSAGEDAGDQSAGGAPEGRKRRGKRAEELH